MSQTPIPTKNTSIASAAGLSSAKEIHVGVGPFAGLKAGKHEIKVWPK